MGRWRSREADLPALDLAPYELTAAPLDERLPDFFRPSGETTRRIERACFGLAAVMLALIVAKTGGAL